MPRGDPISEVDLNKAGPGGDSIAGRKGAYIYTISNLLNTEL